MDKAKLEKRLIDLQAALKQTEANGNALLGAVEECRYWLAQLEQEEIEKSLEKKDAKK